MRVGFTLVDVFTDVPFAGNQLCVVPEPPDDLGSATMQVLAREIGFSETTYVTAVRVGSDDLGPGPIVPVSTGIVHLMVPVVGEDALRRASRDDRGCVDVCARAGVESLYLFAVRGRGDVMARMFDRSAEIGEDPATGSAAGPLGAYLSEHDAGGMPGHVTIAQGEMIGRPSFIEVDVARHDAGWVAFVGGGVQIVGEGSFEL